MTPRRRTVALLAPLLLAASACGKSAQEKLVEQIIADCNALAPNQTTFREALITFRGATFPPVPPPLCRPDFASIPNNDTCGPASAENPVCREFWVWATTDTDLCGPGGCTVLCEARFREADFDASGQDVRICASRGLDQQPAIIPE